MRSAAAHRMPFGPGRLLATLRSWFRPRTDTLPGPGRAELDWLVEAERQRAGHGLSRTGAIARLRARLQRLK